MEARRDHADRRRAGQPLVGHHEHERLRRPAALARDRDPRGIDVRPAEEIVDRPHAVPRLEAHRAEEILLALEALKVVGPLRDARLGRVGRMANLLRVRIADHVVEKRDAAEPRQRDAARLVRIPVEVRLPVAGPFRAFLESPLAVMPVGAEDARKRPFPLRAEEAPGHVEARQAREVEVLDDVVAAVDRLRHDRVERAPLGERPESRGDELLLAQVSDARLPRGEIGGRLEVVSFADLSNFLPWIAGKRGRG